MKVEYKGHKILRGLDGVDTQRDMTNTRCSIVLPMGFKKGGDGHGRY